MRGRGSTSRPPPFQVASFPQPVAYLVAVTQYLPLLGDNPPSPIHLISAGSLPLCQAWDLPGHVEPLLPGVAPVSLALEKGG